MRKIRAHVVQFASNLGEVACHRRKMLLERGKPRTIRDELTLHVGHVLMNALQQLVSEITDVGHDSLLQHPRLTTNYSVVSPSQ